MLVLLDLSAAFDTINHSILLYRLKHYVGIKGTAPRWLRFYLTGRTQFVIWKEYCNLSFGVPQGSVLGPLLVAIYMVPLGDIIRRDGICFHCYADNTQIYIPIGSNDSPEIQKVESCLTAIKKWTRLAQSVEHETRNLRVVGSSPTLVSRFG